MAEKLSAQTAGRSAGGRNNPFPKPTGRAHVESNPSAHCETFSTPSIHAIAI